MAPMDTEEKHRNAKEESKIWRNIKNAIWKEYDGDKRETAGKSSAEVDGCFGVGSDMLDEKPVGAMQWLHRLLPPWMAVNPPLPCHQLGGH